MILYGNICFDSEWLLSFYGFFLVKIWREILSLRCCCKFFFYDLFFYFYCRFLYVYVIFMNFFIKVMWSICFGLEEFYLYNIVEYECWMVGVERLVYLFVVVSGFMVNIFYYINNI